MKYKLNLFLMVTMMLSLVMVFCNPSKYGEESNSDSTKIYTKETLIATLKNNEYEPPFRQIALRLDLNGGVPYSRDDNEYYLEGFEVDEEEILYFLGGDDAVISCFKNEKLLYSKKYSEFLPNHLHLFNNTLYVFDYKFGKNNLFVLNKLDGTIIDNFPSITANKVNNYSFENGGLILRVFNKEEKTTMKTELAYVRYNLQGLLMEAVDNIYNISESQLPKQFEQFLGYWNNGLVFWTIDGSDNEGRYEFILRDKSGETISKKQFENDFFGDPFYGLEGNPREHKKIRNGKIYMLGRKDKDAVITILPLDKLF